MSHLSRFLIIIFVCASIICGTVNSPTASAVSASDWKPGRIIDDTVFMNKGSMTIAQIQQFLESKVPTCDTYGTVGGGWRATYYPSNPPPFTCLKDYKEVPKTTPGAYIPESNYGKTDGSAPAGSKSAAELIWDAAQAYNVNPKVLLVNLQKESSLVTDDWPLKNQFTYAMGARCPDTGPGGSANCDVNYSGFSMQIRESAKLFRYYIDNMDQPWWDNKRPFQTNSIQYNPSVSCGASGIFMESRATTALYVYTPYQPNQSALNAGYGTGDSCSAYGNRNFWLYYNNWFGSALNSDFQLLKSSSGTTQYVVYNGLKQAIPSPYIKIAWGLDNYPVETVDQAYIDSLVNGPNLDIVFRTNSGTELYMVDKGRKYYIQSPSMLATWGLANKAISNVPTGLAITPADGGALSYTARAENTPEVYMLDGRSAQQNTILHKYGSPDILYGIEGVDVNIITISSDLFSTINKAIQSDITSTKIANNNIEYQLVSGQRLLQSSSIAGLYPGVATAVTNSTVERFLSSRATTPFIRSNNSPDVYLIQNGQKYRVTDPTILNEWMGSESYVNIVNQHYINLIPTAPSIVSSSIASTSTNAYVISNGSKLSIPPNLSNAYKKSEFGMSDTLENALPTQNRTISRFVRDTITKKIFMLDNSSVLHPINSIQVAQLWGVTNNNTLNLPSKTIALYNESPSGLSVYVTNGTDSFVAVNGKLKATNTVNANWKLQSPENFTDGTLSTYSEDGALPLTAKSNSNYFRVIDGSPYMTTDKNVATAWGISEQAQDLKLLIDVLLPAYQMLTPVVSYNGTYYVVDTAQFYQATSVQYDNISLPYPKMTLNPATANLPINNWIGPLVKNSNGNWFVLDKGKLRTFNHSFILSQWTNNGNVPVNTLSDNFFAMTVLSTPIERAIKNQLSPKIYSAEAGTKRWITSSEAYTQLYAPYTLVSNELLQALPDGSNIN